MKTEIRLEVLNISATNWKAVETICTNNVSINVTPTELMDLIGFSGGMFLSGKLNEQEQLFVQEYYKLGRKLSTNKS